MDLDKKLEFIVDLILSKKGYNLSTLNISNQTTLADYFVICCGNSELHIKAIANHIVDQAKENEIKVFGVEGLQNAKWVLVDLGDIIVHIFIETARDFYKLDEFWAKKNF